MRRKMFPPLVFLPVLCYADTSINRKMFPPLVFLPVLCYADTSIKKTGVDRMAEQEMLLDSATIKAAVAGEKWATEKVIEHYAPMIDELAVDEDMKQHLIMKLLEALPNFPMEQA